MKRFATTVILGMLASTVHAAAPKCSMQTINGHSSEMCVTSVPFQHDYYSLKVDKTLIFVLPDDFVEEVALTHTVPKDAAIEFPLSSQGTPTVKITGGCTPISEQRETGGESIGVEVGRSCSFKWGNVEVLKDLAVRFD